MGVIDAVRKHPDSAIKFYDVAGLTLGSKGDSELISWLHILSASSLAQMEHPGALDRLAKSRDGWGPSNAFERADMDYQTALVYMTMGQIEIAEQFASAVNGAGRNRPVAVFATVLRATIYVQAGEPRGLLMAKSAIDGVAPLHSVRARERLQPLIVALEARSGSDNHDLAQLATTTTLPS